MVGALLTLLFAALLQLGLVLDVRNTLTDCVSEGARFGGLADRTPAQGAQRARELIRESFPDRYGDDVTASRSRAGGLPEVVVTARVPMPLLGLLGGPGTLVVRGHGAVQELP